MTSRIVQFAYKSPPIEVFTSVADAVIDCREIRNPWFPGITLEEAKSRVTGDPKFNAVVDRGVLALKNHQTVYVGCEYGKHRSVIVALEMASRFIRPLEITFVNGRKEIRE